MTRHTTHVDCIDVAKYQKTVDWPVVRANCRNPDLAAAAFKVSQGKTVVDPTFTRNRTETALAGFRWRFGYHWLDPVTDPVAQAKWYLAHYTPGPGEGCMLDVEQQGPTGTVTVAGTLAFCEYVEGVTGKPVAVYTGVYVSKGSIWNSSAVYNGQRIRWVAAYVSEATVRAKTLPYGFDVWQGDGGATGTFPGVSTPVDLNMIEHPIMLDLACGITATPPVDPMEDSVKTEATPTRVLDTRPMGTPVAAGQVLTVPFFANEVEVVIHVVSPAASGYLVAWGNDPRPPISQLDFAAGVNSTCVARAVLDHGILKITPSAACHIVVDLIAVG